jgi:hypothetical protein
LDVQPKPEEADMELSLNIHFASTRAEGKQFVSVMVYPSDEGKIGPGRMVFHEEVGTPDVMRMTSVEMFVLTALSTLALAIADSHERDGYIPMGELMLTTIKRKEE